MPRPLAPLLAAALASAPAPGRADERPAAVGFYTEAGGGPLFHLGDAAGHSRVGPQLAVAIGRDLAGWLAVGLRLGASTHEATVPPPPAGEYYQLYHGAFDLRLVLQRGPFGLFAEGGAGAAMISTNVLETVQVLGPGERFSEFFCAGGGLEYQLHNRHYAAGVAGQWALMPRFADMQTAGARLYLRYTY
jgi:hypothetical protein